MQDAQESFSPAWVHGLPASLLAPEGKTVAVIALMQRKAGLNRERRKTLEARFGQRTDPPTWLRDLSRTDWNVLAHYMSGSFRFYSFWVVASSLKAFIGKERYAHAIEVQLLGAYDDAWLAQTLDEDQLTASCPLWPQIREGIVSSPTIRAGTLPLGVFMLWPRLRDDLEIFDTLDDARRLTVAHAIFALSTAGRTTWFIDEALRRRRDLVSELGPEARRQAFPVSAERPGQDVAEVSTEATPDESDAGQTQGNGWDSRVARLAQLVSELEREPNRESVEELLALSATFEADLASLPSRLRHVAEELSSRRAALMTLLRSFASQEAFSWMDADLLEQIDARWALAERVHDGEAAAELSDDAARALSRTQEAADGYLAAAGEVSAAIEACDAVDRELAGASGFAEKSAIRRRQGHARKVQHAAEDAQHVCQEQLIDAASPFGEPFDLKADYRQELDGLAPHPLQGGDTPIDTSGAGQEDAVPNVKAVAAPPAPVEVLSIPGETPGGKHAEAGLPSGPGPLVDHSGPQPGAGAPVVPPADVAMHDAQATGPCAHGTDDAMARSHPDAPDDTALSAVVWNCLAQDEPGLAFQAARWLTETSPDIKVPAPELLAATAFASELMVPDGTLQAALVSRLETLEAGAFTGDVSAPWYAALNLLLAASTLRPMVLAPNSGAVSVATYLHLDGNYIALYALVHKLRELGAKLVGFRIDPTVLHRARGEAASKAELEALQRTARDWLRTQAPAYTIRFAAATAVWKHWLRPDGLIESVISPVIHNRVQDAGRVRDAVAALSDELEVQRLIDETDRKDLRRRNGDDIHASAFAHLVRLVDEALALPRQWLALVDLLGGGGSRLRSLLEEVHAALRESRDGVERELSRVPVADHLGMVAASQKQVLKALQGLNALFESASGVRETERTPAEVLGRASLLVPGLSLSENYTLEVGAAAALEALDNADGVLSAPAAQRARVDRGDLLGAGMMVQTGLVDEDMVPLRQERERWKVVLRRELAACREVVEIGLAYGYLQEADRTNIESELARHESHVDDERRFDVVLADIRRIQTRVEQGREDRKREVRSALALLVITDEMKAGAQDVERALDEGDIATAHELLHWLQQGKPTPSDTQEETREGFDAFFPFAMTAIDGWLEGKRPEMVQQALMQGLPVPGIDGPRLDSAQRYQASDMLSRWFDMKGRREVDRSRLEGLLTGLGLTVRSLSLSEKVTGREVWTLEAAPVEDRHVCPVPMFGSAAAGRYRVICVWGRPTEDELLQWVGDPSMSRPTLLLYFGRMTERKWRDLARMSKLKRRAFLFLDETLLVYLGGATGSRLRTWFDVALPFSYSYPYDPTAGLVPPEMFYGRSAELEAVRGPNGQCFIYGGRQLGKTALLKRAEQSFHNPARGLYARWVDLRAEGIGSSLTSSEIWLTLHQRFREMGIIDAKVPAPTPGKKQGVDRVIKGVRDFLEANPDRRVLLLLDEADRFFEQDGRRDFEETRRLKQLMDETLRRFKVVFAGLHNVLRMTGWANHEWANHPLAHFGEPIEVGPLREGAEVAEAIDLIRKPMEAAGFRFESKGLVIRILAQTNYYPSLIQLYCSHLLRHMIGKVTPARASVSTPGPRYVVTGKDIELVYSSDALREEIRAKFRLTLQLDPRYEVLAYAMALALLRSEYSQVDGMPWQAIRQECALRWWAEGFNETSEADFRLLLDEMRGLGVLSRPSEGRYGLRSANVLLLLGTRDEIETVLDKDREPAVEFESTSFRPPMRAASSGSARSIFTYQQLNQLLQKDNFITIVTGNEAAGIDKVADHLHDYLGSGELPLVIGDCSDRPTFSTRLQGLLADRVKDQVSVFVVPESMPWTDLWLKEARTRLGGLRAANRFASVVFVAEPATLWRLLRDGEGAVGNDFPWMSLLHWNEGFLRHWLDDSDLNLEPDERRRLASATGLWPALVAMRAGDNPGLRVLRERIEASAEWPADLAEAKVWRKKLGLDVAEPAKVFAELARYGEPLTAEELAELHEADVPHVLRCMRWAELLGLVRRDGAGYWSADLTASRVVRGLSD